MLKTFSAESNRLASYCTVDASDIAVRGQIAQQCGDDVGFVYTRFNWLRTVKERARLFADGESVAVAGVFLQGILDRDGQWLADETYQANVSVSASSSNINTKLQWKQNSDRGQLAAAQSFHSIYALNGSVRIEIYRIGIPPAPRREEIGYATIKLQDVADAADMRLEETLALNGGTQLSFKIEMWSVTS